MVNPNEPKQTARRLATISRGEREELRFVLREYQGHPFVEVSLWKNRGGRMAPTSFVTIRKSEIGAALSALSDAYLSTKEEAVSNASGVLHG